MKSAKSYAIYVIPPLILLNAFLLYSLFKEDLGRLMPKFDSRQTQAPEIKDIPELKVILTSKDADERRLASRALAEKYGPAEALELLKRSGIPFTGESHLISHEAGFVAFEKYGLDGILQCKDYFLFACYHGAIIQAISKYGPETIVKMLDKCRDWQQRFVQCAHAMGHSLLAFYDYDNLPLALKHCDKILEKEPQYPEALTYCHNGVFMENIFGVHDWKVKELPKRKWLSETDLYYPCNAVEEKYREGCWKNQASRIIFIVHGDLRKIAEACDGVEERQYREWCYDNFGRQIHPMTEGSAEKVFSLCENATGNWKEHCVINNAGAYYSVGGPNVAIEICRKLRDVPQDNCYSLIISQISKDRILRSEKEALCRAMDGDYKNFCLARL